MSDETNDAWSEACSALAVNKCLTTIANVQDIAWGWKDDSELDDASKKVKVSMESVCFMSAAQESEIHYEKTIDLKFSDTYNFGIDKLVIRIPDCPEKITLVEKTVEELEKSEMKGAIVLAFKVLLWFFVLCDEKKVEKNDKRTRGIIMDCVLKAYKCQVNKAFFLLMLFLAMHGSDSAPCSVQRTDSFDSCMLYDKNGELLGYEAIMDNFRRGLPMYRSEIEQKFLNNSYYSLKYSESLPVVNCYETMVPCTHVSCHSEDEFVTYLRPNCTETDEEGESDTGCDVRYLSYCFGDGVCEKIQDELKLFCDDSTNPEHYKISVARNKYVANEIINPQTLGCAYRIVKNSVQINCNHDVIGGIFEYVTQKSYSKRYGIMNGPEMTINIPELRKYDSEISITFYMTGRYVTDEIGITRIDQGVLTRPRKDADKCMFCASFIKEFSTQDTGDQVIFIVLIVLLCYVLSWVLRNIERLINVLYKIWCYIKAIRPRNLQKNEYEPEKKSFLRPMRPRSAMGSAMLFMYMFGLASGVNLNMTREFDVADFELFANETMCTNSVVSINNAVNNIVRGNSIISHSTFNTVVRVPSGRATCMVLPGASSATFSYGAFANNQIPSNLIMQLRALPIRKEYQLGNCYYTREWDTRITTGRRCAGTSACKNSNRVNFVNANPRGDAYGYAGEIGNRPGFVYATRSPGGWGNGCGTFRDSCMYASLEFIFRGPIYEICEIAREDSVVDVDISVHRKNNRGRFNYTLSALAENIDTPVTLQANGQIDAFGAGLDDNNVTLKVTNIGVISSGSVTLSSDLKFIRRVDVPSVIYLGSANNKNFPEGGKLGDIQGSLQCMTSPNRTCILFNPEQFSDKFITGNRYMIRHVQSSLKSLRESKISINALPLVTNGALFTYTNGRLFRTEPGLGTAVDLRINTEIPIVSVTTNSMACPHVVESQIFGFAGSNRGGTLTISMRNNCLGNPLIEWTVLSIRATNDASGTTVSGQGNVQCNAGVRSYSGEFNEQNFQVNITIFCNAVPTFVAYDLALNGVFHFLNVSSNNIAVTYEELENPFDTELTNSTVHRGNSTTGFKLKGKLRWHLKFFDLPDIFNKIMTVMLALITFLGIMMALKFMFGLYNKSSKSKGA